MKYALIGTNINYSISPRIYEYWFKENLLSASYELIDIEYLNFNILKNILDNGYNGLNLTQPFKETLINSDLDIYVDSVVKKINTINTISYKNQIISAYNTDYDGFLQSLNYLNIDLKDKNIFIIGFGSTGKLIYYCLKNLSKNIVIYNRNVDKLSSLDDTNFYKNYKGDIDILINATSVSLEILFNNSDIKSFVKDKNILCVYDVNYRFNNTIILQYMKNKNIKLINGIYMLILQANKNFNIWFDKNILLSKNKIEKLIKELSI